MLKQHVVAAMRQMGKRYPELEGLLDTMTEAQTRELLHLVRDAQDHEKRRMQGQMTRMGIPRGLIR